MFDFCCSVLILQDAVLILMSLLHCVIDIALFLLLLSACKEPGYVTCTLTLTSTVTCPHTHTHTHTRTHRFHKIGLLVLFVQDIGDIFLELSKTVLYFKDRGGKEYWGPELGANLCFACFTIQQ